MLLGSDDSSVTYSFFITFLQLYLMETFCDSYKNKQYYL